MRNPLSEASLLVACAVLFTGCWPEKSDLPVEEVAPRYRDVNKELGIDVAAATQDQEGPEEKEEEPARPLAFASITVEPAQGLKVGGELTAHSTLASGASPFTDIDYRWYRNGRELPGIRNSELLLERIRARKGDVIEVVAEAMDQRGQRAEIKSDPVVVQNSPPVLRTSPSGQHGLDGLVMRAEDPDGDPVSWSLGEGPPGVSIDRSGRIKVQQVDLAEAYSGEVVVIASDPEGARVELHIPVEINASREEVVGKRVLSKERNRKNMTDAEYEKLNIESLEKIEKMTEEEFNQHSREQEARSAQERDSSR